MLKNELLEAISEWASTEKVETEKVIMLEQEIIDIVDRYEYRAEQAKNEFNKIVRQIDSIDFLSGNPEKKG